MKLVEEWQDENYKVEIYAEFKTRGHDRGSWNYDFVDCVEFEGHLTLEDESLTLTDVTYDGKHTTGRFLSKKKINGLENNYKLTLERMRQRLNVEIEETKESIKTITYDQEITDGLPDSLKGM